MRETCFDKATEPEHRSAADLMAQVAVSKQELARRLL
jgi:hypothetical protein